MTHNGGKAWTARLWAGVAVATAGAIAAVVAVWRVPPALYPPDAPEARAALQAGLLTAAAAMVAVAGGLVALAETRRANENTHIRELYTRAIDQLGSDNMTIRLGGIYALERIATDSNADQRTVVEVLSAFVRDRSTDPGLRTPPSPAEGGEGPRRAIDIRAAVEVLARLPRQPDLFRSDLSGADFTGPASLAELELGHSNLAYAQLPGADLTNAYLYRAWLVRANLKGATLRGANLSRTTFSRPKRHRLTAHPERLWAINFDIADLWAANLQDADLTGAWLIEADLTGVRLDGANLTGVRLDGANLTGVRLDGANLTGARLDEANLTRARGLMQEQVNVARGDRWTRLPAGLARPASWITSPSS